MRERTTLPFLVLDLGLNIIDGVGRLNLEGDGLSSKSLDKDLHNGVMCELWWWVVSKDDV